MHRDRGKILVINSKKTSLNFNLFIVGRLNIVSVIGVTSIFYRSIITYVIYVT